jgi:hypothetical protein
MIVRHPPSGVCAELSIPDFAGELFDSHFVTRSFPLDLCDRIQKAAGFLLFLHSKHNADHALLEDAFFMEPVEHEASPPTNSVAWQLERAARQVKLVDLLQFIEEIRSNQAPAKVAVMLSAWDLVVDFPDIGRNAARDIPKVPSLFLSRNWPLLDQFLSNHPNAFQSRVFGVSARGGGTAVSDVERLTGFRRPSDRVFVVDGDHRSHDLSRPIRWLLGLLHSTA